LGCEGCHDIRLLLVKFEDQEGRRRDERAGVRREVRSLSGQANTQSLSRRPNGRQQTNDRTGGGEMQSGEEEEVVS
jgi:hypothetical protein